jgi:hypothetical protein
MVGVRVFKNILSLRAIPEGKAKQSPGLASGDGWDCFVASLLAMTIFFHIKPAAAAYLA